MYRISDTNLNEIEGLEFSTLTKACLHALAHLNQQSVYYIEDDAGEIVLLVHAGLWSPFNSREAAEIDLNANP